jgi:hypothetical protein
MFLDPFIATCTSLEAEWMLTPRTTVPLV